MSVVFKNEQELPSQALVSQPGPSLNSLRETVSGSGLISEAERERAMLAAIEEGLALIDDAGVVIECDTKASQLLGEVEGGVTGKSITDERWAWVGADGIRLEPQAHPLTGVLATGRSSRGALIGYTLPNGAQRWLRMNIEPVWSENPQAVSGVLVALEDVTERWAAERAVRGSEQRLRLIGDHLPNGMVYQLQGAPSGHRRFVYLSAGIERLHGLTAAQVMADASLLYNQIHEEDRPRILALEKAAIANASSFTAEMRIRRVDGCVRWMFLSSAPSISADGTVVWEGIELDVTDRKRLEERLRESHKMEAVGQLARGIAHEFNNILAAIQLYADLLTNPTRPAPLQQTGEAVNELIQRAAELVRQVLAFTCQSVMKPHPADLRAFVRGQCRLLQRLLSERIRVAVEDSGPLPMVAFDENLMGRVLMNLCLNARDAMEDGGLLELRLEKVSRTESSRFAASTDVEFVCLSISDTGSGMDADTQRHLFEPFFTTKEVGKGTGLGLPMARGIVHQHGGFMEVESVLGHGTTVRVYLPVADVALPPVAEEPTHILSKRHKVLLVEDEEMVRLVTRAVLESAGFEVFEAADAERALKVWQSRRDDIDVLYTDMVMPGIMNGLELAERCVADRPDLRVVITSGYTTDLQDLNRISKHFAYLPKPTTAFKLTSTIQACLEETDEVKV